MEDVEPDEAKLCILATELLMAKLEVEEMNSIDSALEQRQDDTGHQAASQFSLSVTGMYP